VSQAKAIKVSSHSRSGHNSIDMANEQREESLEGKRSSELLRLGKREGQGTERASLRAEATFPRVRERARGNRDGREKLEAKARKRNGKEKDGL